MLIKTNAIVLSTIKYREYDLIVKCYTKHRGVVSYLIHGALKTRKGSSKSAYFQLLSQLQFEELYKPNQSLQSMKEVRLSYAYQNLHTNILKSAITMFLAEVMSTVLKEEEENIALYEYIETALQWLDHDHDFSNFHLLFLINLTKYLGFYPDTSNMEQDFFNLNNGFFESKQQNLYSVSGEELSMLKLLLGIKFDAINTIKMNSKQRQRILAMILLYFELHLGDFKKPKSLQIFNQVFS
ncbi:DNA repair protein RecO [Flavobacteriales bacterium 34_180_T64]|nr:DNA repair protein RecO [Flavobacteriales bacterium 34_180_T64]